MNLSEELKKIVTGDVLTDEKTIGEYSKDTSLFKVKPEVVVFPKNTDDIKNIVRFVSDHKKKSPALSITGRSAGTDMTGGPLNESIILGFTKYFNRHEEHAETLTATVEPGVYYRDFEKNTLAQHVFMPTYPASKGIAALGGMIMNNAGGENSLQYGQTRNFVEELSMVLADGEEHTFKKLSQDELLAKMREENFEGDLYRKVYALLESHYDEIKSAKPRVHKNSAGYALWDVWDKEKGTFDMNQLFVGSQGTLGVLTKAKLRLVKDKPHKKLMVLFFKDWNELPAVVNALLPFKPESLEAFDNETLKLGIRFMPEIAKKAGQSFLTFLFRFLPEALMGARLMGLPKLIVLVYVVEETEKEVEEKMHKIVTALKPFHILERILKNAEEAEKYWIMRRESFNLLRQHVHGKRTAPFIEDFCVAPEKIPEFLPQMLAILKEHDIKVNIAGHAGDGNFHIIPLMNLKDPKEREKIPVVAEKVFDLIIRYGGTITAEHNDGIIRTPYIQKMYGPKIYALFEEIKKIFDPQNIFNPGKKVGGTIAYMESHIAGE